MTTDQPLIGYVIVDNETHKLDWDCELHRTQQEAIDSMCGPRQMYARTREEANASEGEKTYWAEHYTICPVLAA